MDKTTACKDWMDKTTTSKKQRDIIRICSNGQKEKIYTEQMNDSRICKEFMTKQFSVMNLQIKQRSIKNEYKARVCKEWIDKTKKCKEQINKTRIDREEIDNS